MHEKILGLDIGIASIGWSVVVDSEKREERQIMSTGSYIFPAAENPKDKSSLNLKRREYRLSRRNKKNKKSRLASLKNLLIENNYLPNDFFNFENFWEKNFTDDVWSLRTSSLQRQLSNLEFSRILLYLVKHRGFSFEIDVESEELGKIKESSIELLKKFEETKSLTVGEYINKNYSIKRNRGIKETIIKNNKKGEETISIKKKPSYVFSIPRELIRKEIELIFLKQKEFGFIISDEFISSTLKIFNETKEPKSIESKVGYCSFFEEEKRAPKMSYLSEKFISLSKFYNTVVVSDSEEVKIKDLKDIPDLFSFVFSKEIITYKDLRDFLKLKSTDFFKGLSYSKKQKKDEIILSLDVEKKVWLNLKGFFLFKKALDSNSFEEFMSNEDLVEEVSLILSYFLTKEQRIRELNKIKLPEKFIEPLSTLSFSDFLNISTKAIKIINLSMIEGKRYDEAILIFGKKEYIKNKFLPPLKELGIEVLNPVVERAFSNTRQIINALIRKYGSFDKIHIELSREVNPLKVRDEIISSQKKRTKENEEIKEYLKSIEVKITSKNILKMRLFKQQNGICLYSSEKIEINKLFLDSFYEIDHIFPLSRTFDDSVSNKVLVLKKENQEKLNLIPFEYLSSEKFLKMRNLILEKEMYLRLGKSKVNKLLKESLKEEDERGFIERNLNDTRYASKLIKDVCERYLEMNTKRKKSIFVRNGKLTSLLRKHWNLKSKNRDNYLHHAEDAILIAFSSEKMVSSLRHFLENKREFKFEEPLIEFNQRIEEALQIKQEEIILTKEGKEKSIFRFVVSRSPIKKITGPAHQDTIRSLKDLSSGVLVNKGRGICLRKSMVRLDVFQKEGKIFLVPLYVHDFVAKEINNTVMYYGFDIDESYSFLFSLQTGDLISYKQKGCHEIFCFYNSVDISSVRLSLNNIDNKEEIRLSLGKIESFKKYQMDSLGYYNEVKSEKRKGIISNS